MEGEEEGNRLGLFQAGFGSFSHLSSLFSFLLCFSYDFKPSGTSELEEDEGFSDWSQKLEQRKQRWVGHSWTEGRGINVLS